MWKALQQSMPLVVLPPSSRPIGPCRDSDILQFQESVGTKLPLSYCRFAKEFGAGMINETYRIHTPYQNRHCQFELNPEYISLAKKDWICRMPSSRIVKNTLFFGDDVFGNYFGWNIHSAAISRTREYPIYVFDPSQKKPKKVATRFIEFVAKYCFTEPFTNEKYLEDIDERPQFGFRPCLELSRKPKNNVGSIVFHSKKAKEFAKRNGLQ